MTRQQLTRWERLVSHIHVRGVLTLSMVATSGWIITLALLEWCDKYITASSTISGAASFIASPVQWDAMQGWLNAAWALHVPILVSRDTRPHWITVWLVRALVFHWFAFFWVIGLSGWYDVGIKVLVFMFFCAMCLCSFRVEIGDKAE